SQRVVLRDCDLLMLSTESSRNLARILPFVELLFLEHQREAVRAHAVMTHHGNQSAGVDSAGKKYSHRHIADKVSHHRITENGRQLRYRRITTCPPFYFVRCDRL